MAVFIFSAVNNTYAELTKLSPKVQEYLYKNTLPAGSIITKAD